MLSTKDQLQNSGHIRAESERMEKKFYANDNQKRTEVVILISDKAVNSP